MFNQNCILPLSFDSQKMSLCFVFAPLCSTGWRKCVILRIINDDMAEHLAVCLIKTTAVLQVLGVVLLNQEMFDQIFIHPFYLCLTPIKDRICFVLKLRCSEENLGCFHTTAKCVFWIVIWIVIRDAHLESRFKIQYFDRVYAKKHRESWFEMRNSKTHLRRDLRCASQITILDVFWRTHGPKYCISNRDSRCAFLITIQNTHFAVVWKQP